MNTTELEKQIIESMLELCKTQMECKEWVAHKIQTSYSKAEGMRTMQNAIAVQAYYTDIRTYARLRFYLDELTNHLPA